MGTRTSFPKGHVFQGLKRGGYRVLYVDPPWSFATWSHRGQGKGASQHYQCMKLDQIAALPIGDIAMVDAAMFLWVVQPMLPEAMNLLDAWGFKFRTVAFCWIKMPSTWTDRTLFRRPTRIKPRLGLGYHTRSGMEQCWLAIRGKGYERKAQGIEQVLHSPIREHSRKPDEFAERIEELTGDVPRVELFARQRRPRWDVWGDEV